MQSRNYAQQELLVHYAALKVPTQVPSGMYIIPNQLNWSGVLFIHKGIYANAVFRFTVGFGDPTIVAFQSDVYHPLINDGILQVPDRSPVQVLFYVKEIFKSKYLDTIHATNECFNTYVHDKARFIACARQCAALSRTKTILYQDHHELRLQESELSYEDMVTGIKAYLQ